MSVRRTLIAIALCLALRPVWPLESLAAEERDVNRPIRDKWALVIGISEFANPKLNLQYPAKDAQDFAQYLINEAGFARDHVKVLVNRDATEKRILSELGNKWLPHVANPDDLVVLFISTHGSGAELDVGGQNYLLAYDTDVEDLYTSGIPMQKLARDIRERIHCDRVVIFLDACHSGATTTGGAKGLFRSGVDAAEIAAGSGQLVITSSKEDQVSWESKTKPNSVFTSTLLDALRSRGGQATVGQVYDSLKDRVQDTVLRERGVLQTPVMKSEWQGNDLILASKPANPQPGLNETTEATGTTSSASPSSSSTTGTASSTAVVASAASSSGVEPPPVTPPAPTSRLVPGRSVGRTRLGMTMEEITKLLGRPTQNAGDVLIYRSQDRRNFLALHFKNNVLHDIAFSSPVFSTEDGISVKSFVNDNPSPKVVNLFDKRIPFSNGTVLYERDGGGLIFVTGPGNEIGIVTNTAGDTIEVGWIPGLQQGTPAAAAGSPRANASNPPSSVGANQVQPGKGLNNAQLGMSKDAVLIIFGKPTTQSAEVFTYYSQNRAAFLSLLFEDDILTEIAFTSHKFETADGIGLKTFNQPEVRKKFASATASRDGRYRIFRTKGGGFSIAIANDKAVGWIHAVDSTPDQVFWP